MHRQTFSEKLNEILKQDRRYDGDAYYFVREGLDYTLKILKKGRPGGQRHVAGPELLEGLRRYALDQFGPLGKTVFDHWGVRRCEDFGEIVFNMVDKGILGRTDQDSRADFKGGYDFEEAFVKPFRPAPRSNGRRHTGSDRTGSDRFQPAARGSGAHKLNSSPN